MEVHLFQILKINDSKKKIISDLVCQRINLLIGARKASYIENVFFCDTLPKDVLPLHSSAVKYNLNHHIGLCLNCGKANLYCTAQMLYSLIHQTADMPSFDDAIIAISREFPVSFLS